MLYIFLFIFIIVIISYSLFKERSEMGCLTYFIFDTKKQCNEQNSVYVNGTQKTEEDNCDMLYTKLSSILNFHEKGAVWRRSILLASVLVFIVYMYFACVKKYNITIYDNFFIGILLLAIIYFYHNFMNYHFFRLLKNNGEEIISVLKEKCSKK